MKITFLGATRKVTGSCFLVECQDHKLLVDCGLHQGGEHDEALNGRPFEFDAGGIDAVVLTHAHMDHSGRLPLLVKQGFSGPIYTHAATKDLCDLLLNDAARLQEEKEQPLYSQADVKPVIDCIKTVNYGQSLEILPGVKLCLYDAGHILGSAIVELRSHGKTCVFTGDLGHKGAPILRDPVKLDHADIVVMESTYGDRQHRDWQATWDELAEIVNHSSSPKGNILIPAFSIGRTQELLYLLHENFESWHLNKWKIFLDSPMGVAATEIYAKYPELYDKQAKQIIHDDGSPYRLPNLHISQTGQQSRHINKIKHGAIIIAGSGMCNGGRITHHIKHNIENPDTQLIMIGYQAQGTLGRQLVDGAKQITVSGETLNVKAKIHTVGGLSAHADQKGLIDWYANFKNKPKLALTHGEHHAMQALAKILKTKYKVSPQQPFHGDTITLPLL